MKWRWYLSFLDKLRQSRPQLAKEHGTEGLEYSIVAGDGDGELGFRLLLASIALQHSDLREAALQLDRARLVDRHNQSGQVAEILYREAILCFKAGNLRDAERVAKMAVLNCSSGYRSLLARTTVILGQVEYFCGRFSEAIECFDVALSLLPSTSKLDRIAALSTMSLAYREAGNFDRTYWCLKRACMEADPSQTAAYARLCWQAALASEEIGGLEESAAFLAKARAGLPADPLDRALISLDQARLSLKLSDSGKGRCYLQEAHRLLEAMPKNKTVAAAQETCRETLHGFHHTQAVQLIQEIVSLQVRLRDRIA